MAWRSSPFGRRAVRNLTCLGFTLCLLLWGLSGLFDPSARRYDTWRWTACPGSSPFERSCTASRAATAQNIQIVIKTGASEPESRLLHQLATVLSEAPRQNVLILSDLDEKIGSFHIHDVYADILQQERAKYPEFALYDLQQEFRRQGEDPRELQLQGGWDLAKYMNLAMTRKIWAMQQDMGDGRLEPKDWYIFLDTDTFIERDKLSELLQHLNAAKRIYVGSPVWLPGLQFAHDGSAYVLSHGAMTALNTRGSHDPTDPLYSQYGLKVTEMCCGDEAIAKVLKSKGVPLKGYWPMFNGEIPATVPFSRHIWCEPVISTHHLHGEDMRSLWQWIEDWKTSTGSLHPFLFRDLFQYIAPQITDKLEGWDNTADDMKIYPCHQAAHHSFENCREACRADKLCFQFGYNGTTCALSHQIRLGRRLSTESSGRGKYISGWDTKRIRDWTRNTKCESMHGVKSNP